MSVEVVQAKRAYSCASKQERHSSRSQLSHQSGALWRDDALLLRPQDHVVGDAVLYAAAHKSSGQCVFEHQFCTLTAVNTLEYTKHAEGL